MFKLAWVCSFLVLCKLVNSNAPLEKILETNSFNDYILLNAGVSEYIFTYKPQTVLNNDLESEQFLVIDFANFEMRDSFPYLPEVRIVYTDKEDPAPDQDPSSSSNQFYFHNQESNWYFDEGYYVLPLLSSIKDTRVKKYIIEIKFAEKSFYQSVKFRIGLFYIEGNTSVGFDTRIPFKVKEGKNSVLSIPLKYQNKNQLGNNDVKSSQDLECGIELNFCQGTIKKVTISAIDKTSDTQAPKQILELKDLVYDVTGTFRRFSIPVTTKSLRIESESSDKLGAFGKLRVTCQNVDQNLDLKTVETVKNTILSIKEDDVQENMLTYTVENFDSTLVNQYGTISFYKNKRDARFKSQCGFEQSLFSNFLKIKSGAYDKKMLFTQYSTTNRFYPTQRTPATRNFMVIPNKSGEDVYSFFKIIQITNNIIKSPTLNVYNSDLMTFSASGGLIDPQVAYAFLFISGVLILLLFIFKKKGWFMMRRMEDDMNEESTIEVARPGRAQFERVTSIPDDWTDTRDDDQYQIIQINSKKNQN